MTSYTGKISTFGGPNDIGVSKSEGLALIEPADLESWWYRHLFLDQQPRGTTGLARRLNPDAYYIAMRWATSPELVGKPLRDAHGNSLGICLGVHTPRRLLRTSYVQIVANGHSILARPVDWGPNGNTNRIADLSPGAASALGLHTDQTATIILPW